jgi:hypothetical protein
MTALNFPATPSDGDTFDNYIYDGVKEVWRIQPNIPGISSRFKVSATAPTNPADGEVWLNSTDGNTYIYYSDGDSAQWIEIGGTTGNPPDLDSLNDVTITSPTTDQLLRWNGTAWVNGTANTNSIADGAVTASKLANTAGAVMVFDDSAARTAAIPSPSEGMVTYLKDTDSLEQFTGAAFVPVSQPGVLQVVSTTITATFASTSSTFETVTGFTASITPQSTSSKIIVTATFRYGSTSSSGERDVRFLRDATGIALGPSVGSLSNVFVLTGNSNNFMDTVFTAVDSPNTTSSTTYSMQTTNTAGTLYIGGRGDDRIQDRRYGTFVLMEVAG